MIATFLILTGVFFIGAFAGSFAHTLAIRLKDKSVILGRPRCVHCQTGLKPHHLVPVFSWLLLRGRCAFCRRPIQVYYPVVEGLSGLLFLIAFVRHPFVADFGSFLFEALFALVLLLLVVFDWRWKLLPLEFIGASALVFGVWNVLAGYRSLSSVLIGLAAGAGFLGLQVLVSRGKWLGSGDPWMGGLLGLALGWPLIGVGLYFTYLLGGLVAFFLVMDGAKLDRQRLPFAPLLAAGALSALWFGPRLVALVQVVWYGAV